MSWRGSESVKGMSDRVRGFGSFAQHFSFQEDQLAPPLYLEQKGGSGALGGGGRFPFTNSGNTGDQYFSQRPPSSLPIVDIWGEPPRFQSGVVQPMTGVFTGNPPFQVSPPSADKRFKSLPPAEALPRSEPLGGYIFVCNNDTMEENLKRQLFGLPQRYRDSVRAIQPGLPLFLYNYTSHQLHGIFEASSFGGSNIDPTAWEDKKSPGESRFPAQVRIRVRKRCKALNEEQFRPVLHHYDGPKFRLQLSVPETLSLLDLFEERDGPETPPQQESPHSTILREDSPFNFG